MSPSSPTAVSPAATVKRKLENFLAACHVTTASDQQKVGQRSDPPAALITPAKRAKISNAHDDRQTPSATGMSSNPASQADSIRDADLNNETVKLSLWNTVVAQMRRCASVLAVGNTLTHHGEEMKETIAESKVECVNSSSENSLGGKSLSNDEGTPNGPIFEQGSNDVKKSTAKSPNKRRGKRERCGVRKATKNILADLSKHDISYLEQWFEEQTERMMMEIESLKFNPGNEHEKNVDLSQHVKHCLEQWFKAHAERMMTEMEGLRFKPADGDEKIADLSKHAKSCLEQWLDEQAKQMMTEMESLKCKPANKQKQKASQDVGLLVKDEKYLNLSVHVKPCLEHFFDVQAKQIMTEIESSQRKSATNTKLVPQTKLVLPRDISLCVKNEKRPSPSQQHDKVPPQRITTKEQSQDLNLSRQHSSDAQAKQMIMEMKRVESKITNEPYQVPNQAVKKVEKNVNTSQKHAKSHKSYVEEWKKLGKTYPHMSSHDKERMMIEIMGLFSTENMRKGNQHEHAVFSPNKNRSSFNTKFAPKKSPDATNMAPPVKSNHQ